MRRLFRPLLRQGSPSRNRSGAGGGAQAAEGFLQALPADAFPYLAEMAATQAANAGYDADADFAFGLNLILDGLQRVLDPTRS